MGNALGENIEGKVVLLDAEYLSPAAFGCTDKADLAEAAEYRCFEVTGGSGAHPKTHGQALLGTFLFDGEHCRMEGYQVERLATDEEIAKAKEIFKHREARKLRAETES